jgi:glucoamylase
MPLLWAHAEYIKLAAAIFLGHPVERLQCVTQRYQCRRPEAATWFWRADQPFQSMPGGVDLVIEDPQPFRIERVSADGALQSTHAAEAAAFGMYEVRFSRASIGTATRLFFHQQFTGPKPPTDFAIGIDPDVAGQPHS